MKHIGVLLPQSKTYPRIGKDFIKGIKSRFGDEEVKLTIEDVGFGAEPKVVMSSIDRLVLQHDVDSIVGFFGNLEIESVYDKINAMEVPSVMVDFGVHQPISYPNNEYLFTISLDMCKSLELMGKWFSENKLTQIGLSGSFNDVGYGMVGALQKSVYDFGGEFSGHYTPALNPRENETDFLKDFYVNSNSDVVVNLYNGDFTKENIDYIESAELKDVPPLVFTPFGLNTEDADRISKLASDVYIVGSWIPQSFVEEENKKSVFNDSKLDDSPFAALGFEVGSTILETFPIRKDVLNNSSNHSVTSPRTVNSWSSSLHLNVEQFLWKLNAENSECMAVEVSSFHSEEYLKNYESSERVVSGWHNIYLCY